MGKFESFAKKFSRQAKKVLEPEETAPKSREFGKLVSNRIYSFLLVAVIVLTLIPITRLLSPGAEGSADISAIANKDANNTLVVPRGLGAEEGNQDLVLTANAVLAKEINSDEPLYTYRAKSRWPIASLTKLMTATVALEELQGNTIVEISQKAVNTEGVAGRFAAGQSFTVSDLVKAMMTVSSNDAAVALDEEYSQRFSESVPSPFIKKMRTFSTEIGMENTFFNDSTGLSAINQSTPKDIEKLILYILANHPEVITYSGNYENLISNREDGAARKLTNINEFAIRSDFIGGKTGFTDDAGENLVSIFKYNNKKFLIIIFGSKDRFGETLKIYDWIKDYE